jgi:signal transduction histidine kinase
VIQAVVEHFGQENCSCQLVDRTRGVIVELARRGSWYPSVGLAGLRLDGPGLIAEAVRKKCVVSVGDVGNDPRYLLGWPEARSELVVPLVSDGEVLGVFDLQSSRPDAFGPDEIRLLTPFAERTALALRLIDLVQELEQRTRVLESVTRATQLLNFRLHAPDVLSSVVEETSRAFPSSDGCVAYVAGEDGDTLSVAAAFGVGMVTLATHGHGPIPANALICAGRSLRENRPVLVATSGLDELTAGLPLELRAKARAAVDDPEVRHLMAAPIRVGDQRLGVIEVLACRPGAFSTRDQETLVLLAEQAAIALRNARLIEELRRSNQMKDEFLANLSHEVRTPLTGIVGWAEVLLESRGEDAETRRALQKILGQADTLSRMLGDLIDLSRIDNLGLQIRTGPVRISEPISEALDAVVPSADRRGVKIACDIPADLPVLEGDSSRLKQVIWNLLTNGVKFSPSGGTVTITARATPERGIELGVSDGGFGIEEAFLPHVFERFRQEESAVNRRFGGLGVGLSIARAIVQAHGGTLEVSSQGRDRGSHFRVRLPAPGVKRPSGSFPKFDGHAPGEPPR